MTTITVTINDDEQRRRAIDAILRCNLAQPMTMTLKPFESKRTLSMNSLWWIWMQEMSVYFSAKSGSFSKEEMHTLMKHKFLGYAEEMVVGSTKIPSQLKSTTKLTKGDMLYFMEQVDAWAADHGCLLTRPETSEYENLSKRQNV